VASFHFSTVENKRKRKRAAAPRGNGGSIVLSVIAPSFPSPPLTALITSNAEDCDGGGHAGDHRHGEGTHFDSFPLVRQQKLIFDAPKGVLTCVRQPAVAPCIIAPSRRQE